MNAAVPLANGDPITCPSCGDPQASVIICDSQLGLPGGRIARLIELPVIVCNCGDSTPIIDMFPSLARAMDAVLWPPGEERCFTVLGDYWHAVS